MWSLLSWMHLSNFCFWSSCLHKPCSFEVCSCRCYCMRYRLQEALSVLKNSSKRWIVWRCSVFISRFFFILVCITSCSGLEIWIWLFTADVPVEEYTAVSLPRGFQCVCVRIWKSKLASKSVRGWVCILFSLEYKVSLHSWLWLPNE